MVQQKTIQFTLIVKELPFILFTRFLVLNRDQSYPLLSALEMQEETRVPHEVNSSYSTLTRKGKKGKGDRKELFRSHKKEMVLYT